uniref:DNA helicase n=1 Tax=Tanacetum cinerariifolium TaxID=118510 RepID=A0A6L2MF95_TANCI|nr:DNA helicase [Tanacetum cinerariifolium]
MMVHGPCGPADLTASCMKENLCSKKFPKKFNNETYFDKNDYVTSVEEIQELKLDLDNSHVPQRKRGQGSIGRLVYVQPNSGELFYLRMLLCHQKGCTTFKDIQTVNHKVYETFRSACDALGLFGDDKEWDTALEEACFSSIPSQLRSLFVHILIFCDVLGPLKLWKKHWQEMSDDIPKRTSNNLHIPNLHMNDPELEGTVLYELQAILNSNLKAVTDFGLPPLSERLLNELRNKEMMEEKIYNREELAEEVVTLVPRLNVDQKKISYLIMNDSAANRQELIFVYGHEEQGRHFYRG